MKDNRKSFRYQIAFSVLPALNRHIPEIHIQILKIINPYAAGV